MSYTALYRKFRPVVFADVKGQDPIVTTLKNQLTADRIGHAYLFCGTRGTGKTTVAKILARAVNCEHPVNGEPCNECAMCRSILDGSGMNVIEIDAASNNGVDNIRDIREETQYRPTKGRYKVYIIDEVHMLSPSAFNALLKTLEEPPEYVIFILATTEAQKIPATILSRCQRYDFRRISLEVITSRLQELLLTEGIEAEEKAVRYVARVGDGSMRDALSLLDRCSAFYLGETLTYEKVLDILGTVDTSTFSRLLREILKGDVAAAIRILEELIISGRELGQLTGDFTWYLRNLLLVRTAPHPEEVVDASKETLRLLAEESRMVEEEVIMRYIRVLSELSANLRNSAQKRVLMEMALIRMCRPAMQTDPGSLLDRIRTLERELEELKQRPVSSALVSPVQKASEEATTVRPKEIPAAKAPLQLQRIVESWSRVVEHTSNTLKQVLKASRPGFDTQGGEPVLYVLLEENSTAAAYVSENPERNRELQEAVREVTGLSAEIRLVMNRQAPASVAPFSFEQAVREKVLFENVEVADD